MIRRKACVGEILSILAAAKMYLVLGFVKTSFVTVFCVENVVANNIIVAMLSPLMFRNAILKKTLSIQSEYVSSGVLAVVESIALYKGASLLTLDTALASRSLCYPVALMLMFMFTRSIRGRIAKSFVLVTIGMVAILCSVDYSSKKDFFDCWGGATHILLHAVFGVSSDFITVCMANRGGLIRFLFAKSFYFALFSCLALMTFRISGREINQFIQMNWFALTTFCIICVVSNILNAFYIQRFGIVAYNTTKISSYLYFDVIRSMGRGEGLWRAELALFGLIMYICAVVFMDQEDGRDTVLGFAM